MSLVFYLCISSFDQIKFLAWNLQFPMPTPSPSYFLSFTHLVNFGKGSVSLAETNIST